MPANEGRCVSCGFLAKFDLHYSGPPPYIYEMPPKDRGTGERSGIRLEAAREITGFPQCYVNAFDLWNEIRTAVQDGNNEFAAARQVFDSDRHCSKWHRYTQGYSPQEHLEELRVQELESKRQEFEHRMEVDKKNFELKLFKMGQELAQRHQRVNFWLAVALGSFAIVEAIATVLQLRFPNGWPWLTKWFFPSS